MNLNETITELATVVVAARETGRDPAPVLRREARALRLTLTPAVERAVWLRAKNLWDRTQADLAALAA